MDELTAIKAAVEKAKDGLPVARYHSNMLRFLCHEMEKVEHLLPQLHRETPQNVLQILKDEMERGARLISRHGRRFDLRNFSKVDLVSSNVEQMCLVFRECLCDLGLEEDTIDIKTKMDADSVAEDQRYMYWYLTCILEGRDVDRQIPDGIRKELEEQMMKQKHRMEFVTMIPEQEIVQMEKIGEGGCGQVFKGCWKNVPVAIKMLRSDLTPESRAEFLSEVQLHIQLSHPNVVRCLGAMASNGIVMELASTDLEKFYWRQGDEWDWLKKLQLMLNACSGLQHLHNNKVVHGDIKTANFLVFDSPLEEGVVVKISDFGLAATKTGTRSKTAFPMAGTFLWMAPELCEGAAQAFSADVFSFGLVLFELSALSPPYKGLNSNPIVLQRKKDGKNPVPIPEDCPEALSRLMKRCIAVEPCDRPTMEQVGTRLTDIVQQAMASTSANSEVALTGIQPCQPPKGPTLPRTPLPVSKLVHSSTEWRELAELERDNPAYEAVRVVGRGTCGVVLLACNRGTDVPVAVKMIPRSKLVNECTEREVLNHRLLYHPHVIQFHEAFLTQGNLCIAMEYAEGGTLLSYVQARKRLAEPEARHFFQQLIMGLDYCHIMGVVSHDIQLENTLLDGSQPPNLKICDFVYSKDESFGKFPDPEELRTARYIAPEIATNRPGASFDGKVSLIHFTRYSQSALFPFAFWWILWPVKMVG
ncbi:unnamed protein product [Ostreobium quekettii]|uniref:Protein kinase domain-containing protein n=1 Tax=Ostreobium quekettii TaxID=121088 RepID=A0A8S1JE93_9CHLO|nr:unnamed protein product [Ostreobium quekettii]|eukprot:evm.model.scf_389.3 EVM.evm.TU.scf_389.3   scf_389:29093-35086(-)